MSQGLAWFLYDPIGDKRFDELTFESAVKLLDEHVSFKMELENWLVWNEEMSDWKPVSAVQEFTEKLAHKEEKKQAVRPPIPGQTRSKIIVPPTPPAFQTKRRFERFSMRLRVVLFAKDKTFRTFTRDISEGGMLLENKVPDTFLRNTCEILIGSPDLKENVQFTGNVIGDAANPFRFAFVEQGENSSKRIAQWFALFSSVSSRSAS